MKRHRRNLKRQTGGDENEADDDAQLGPRPFRRNEHAGKGLEFGGAGETVNHGNAIKQHAGGQRPEDEVFQPGLGRTQGVAPDRGEDVERQALQLQSQIKRKQIVRRDHHQHAERGEQNQKRIFEPLGFFAAQVIEREDERQGGGAQHHNLHEHGEAVAHEHARKRHDSARLHGELHDERDRQGEDAHPRDRPCGAVAPEHAVDEQAEPDDRQENLRHGGDHIWNRLVTHGLNDPPQFAARAAALTTSYFCKRLATET